MSTEVVSVAAAFVVALLLLVVAHYARLSRRSTTYVCSSCLYATSDYPSALLHVASVHPKESVR